MVILPRKAAGAFSCLFVFPVVVIYLSRTRQQPADDAFTSRLDPFAFLCVMAELSMPLYSGVCSFFNPRRDGLFSVLIKED